MSETTTLTVDIVTPERRIWQGRARMLVAKGSEGELGVLPGHIPLVTPLVDGDVRLHGAVADSGVEGGERSAASGGDMTIHCKGGFLVVDGEGARVLADHAEIA